MRYNLCLQDVEANTVRLKEHDQDVLVLEKVPAGSRASNQGNSQPQQKYVCIRHCNRQTMINLFTWYHFYNSMFSLSLFFFLWKMAVCMTFFSLYWLITHLVAYNVSISGTALRLVLWRVVPERILSFSEAPPSTQCSHNSFQKKTLSEQRKDACQAAQGTGPSDEKLWYLNVLGRFLVRHFHLGIRVTKQHGQNSDSE